MTDSRTAWEVSEHLDRENHEGHLSGFRQVRALESFLDYLRTQFDHLKAAYPEFGRERAGASFVMMQIESATRYFRNPTNPNRQQNYLDE